MSYIGDLTLDRLSRAMTGRAITFDEMARLYSLRRGLEEQARRKLHPPVIGEWEDADDVGPFGGICEHGRPLASCAHCFAYGPEREERWRT